MKILQIRIYYYDEGGQRLIESTYFSSVAMTTYQPNRRLDSYLPDSATELTIEGERIDGIPIPVKAFIIAENKLEPKDGGGCNVRPYSFSYSYSSCFSSSF